MKPKQFSPFTNPYYGSFAKFSYASGINRPLIYHSNCTFYGVISSCIFVEKSRINVVQRGELMLAKLYLENRFEDKIWVKYFDSRLSIRSRRIAFVLPNPNIWFDRAVVIFLLS